MWLCLPLASGDCIASFQRIPHYWHWHGRRKVPKWNGAKLGLVAADSVVIGASAWCLSICSQWRVLLTKRGSGTQRKVLRAWLAYVTLALSCLRVCLAPLAHSPLSQATRLSRLVRCSAPCAMVPSILLPVWFPSLACISSPDGCARSPPATLAREGVGPRVRAGSAGRATPLLGCRWPSGSWGR